MDVSYFNGSFSFTVPVKAKNNINFTKDIIEAIVSMQLCEGHRCLPPNDFKAVVTYLPNESTVVTTQTSCGTNSLCTDVAPCSSHPDLTPTQNQEVITKTDSQIEIERKKSEGF